MAFKPTRALQARTEARLRGWRQPAVRLLRQEVKRTDPTVLNPAFTNVAVTEPRKGMPAEEAYRKMGLPMEEVLAMRGGTRRGVEKEDVVQTSRLPQPREEPPEVGELELSVARAVQKRPRKSATLKELLLWNCRERES